MVQARIHQRVKSSMSSGRGLEGEWMLEYEPAEAKRADPLMGWPGSGDTREQVRLFFKTLDDAKAFAERNGLQWHVTPTGGDRRLKIQAYADNFKGPRLDF